MTEKMKKCPECGEIKPLKSGFYETTRKGIYQVPCKVCKCAHSRADYHKKSKRKNRKFTLEEKVIFQLGVSVGEGRAKNVQRAINIQMRANRQLFKIIQEMDNE